MKRALLLIACSLSITSLFAQTDKDKKNYADRAAQLQTDIWGNPIPEFKLTTAPANFSKESAVILARSYSLSRASSGKLKFGHAIGITTRTTKFSIFHERVKINDKTALESYSTLEYQKKLDKSTSEGFAKYVNTNNTYIGAKVLKPTGKEVIVNSSEEVLINNEKKDQKGKLAIPDLQVGDILDYYICKEDVADKDEGNAYKDNDNLFFLVDEYPVIYYSIDFQFNKKIRVRTIYANGAQHFEENQNNEGDQLFSLKLHNIPKYQSQLWTSAFRQYPYIEIGSAYDDPLDKIIDKNGFEENSPMLQAQKYTYEHTFAENDYPISLVLNKYKDYFKSKKALKSTPLDSAMKIMYAVWKFDTFCSFIGGGPLSDFPSWKYRRASSKVNTAHMCMMLTDQKIDFDVLVVAQRHSNSLENVFNYEDFDALIRINGEKPMYMCFDDVVTHFNEIPERYQGEKVIVLHPQRRSFKEYTFTEGNEEILPKSTSEENNIEEHLNVSLTAQDMQKLKIERTVREIGSVRHDDQKTILGSDDVDEGLRQAVNGSDVENRFKGGYITASKKVIAELKAVVAKEASEKGKNFNTEIKDKYDQEPEGVTNCKVISYGMDATTPVFEHTETFILKNLVKKAGNNYIIDAGKLTGGFLTLEEKDKKRDKDIYMTSARSFKYAIVIDIPLGYAPKGMEELTQNKSNKTGSFTSSATVKGNKLTISVNRVYKNNFEKASDWPLLVDVINTASDFDSKKILLEKQN